MCAIVASVNNLGMLVRRRIRQPERRHRAAPAATVPHPAASPAAAGTAARAEPATARTPSVAWAVEAAGVATAAPATAVRPAGLAVRRAFMGPAAASPVVEIDGADGQNGSKGNPGA